MKSNIDKYNEIKAPAGADIAIEKGIRMGERHFVFRRSLTSLAAAVAVCVCVAISGFVSPTMASVLVKLPVVGPIFENSYDRGLRKVSEKGLSEEQDLQITSDGVTVAIKEVYFDKSGISIGYIVSGAAAQSKNFLFTFYNDGKVLYGGGSGDINPVSEDLYSGIVTFIPGEQLPDSFNLRVVASESLDGKSPYDFTIRVSRNQADLESREITLMKYASSDDRSILIKKAVFTPASITLNLEYTVPKFTSDAMFQLIDENGNTVQVKSMGGGIIKNENKETDVITAIFDAFENIPEKLTLKVLEDGNAVMEMEFEVE